LQQSVSELNEKVAARPTLESDLRTLADERANAKAENQALVVKMNELKERIERLSEVEGVNCPLCSQPSVDMTAPACCKELQDSGKEKGDTFRKNHKSSKIAKPAIRNWKRASDPC